MTSGPLANQAPYAKPRIPFGVSLASLFHGAVTAWLVLATGLVVTGAAWYTSVRATEQAAHERLHLRSEEIANAIESRMILYEQVLWGGIGLFNATGDVSRSAFRAYVDTLDLDTHWPGVQGIGFSRALSPDLLVPHTLAVRAEGFPDYQVKPAGPRDFYSAIVYLEPFDWRNQRAFGYDMWSNPVRREAMKRSMESGKAHTSGVITLVQETSRDKQRGFLTYTPLYAKGAQLDTVEQRRAAIVGWVYAPFRMNNLMQGILGSTRDDIGFRIYDTAIDNENLLYDKPTSTTPDLETVRTLNLQGRRWHVVFGSTTTQLLGEARSLQPSLIALAGLIVELLLFSILRALQTSQIRAERIAAERTAELQEAQQALKQKVIEGERMVEVLFKANEELSQFAHIASHDMKEPLRMVSNFTSLLEEDYGGQLDETATLYIRTAREAAERMQAMVSDLLEYARLDHEAESNQLVDLNQTFNAVCEDLRTAISGSKGTVSLLNPLPSLSGNPTRLRSLFQNLIGNGLKYQQPDRPPEITVSTRETDEQWQIAISDNGIGIDERYHQRIFQPFKRLHNAEEYPGTGVGLAICNKIATELGGSIELESTPGLGSRFTVFLPKIQPEMGA
ncbi:signal transduction histidine kinase [Litorivivens lipolytica]|uniref:histidine kinase n=1 Tax=Litorivivens lipolytica TaxID=1524264 RepID=A0A7W4Z810_9GAMM|nr:CHASE domain-containing protein [Litorivivens lipolytica]MBB3048466.1 signal transduction histidine kinase [Litorivivens lipolytica]